MHVILLLVIIHKPYKNELYNKAIQIVDKDELLKSMQTHLERCEERMKEQKIDYDLRIQKLNEELRQATMNPVETTVTRWWHKLLK